MYDVFVKHNVFGNEWICVTGTNDFCGICETFTAATNAAEYFRNMGAETQIKKRISINDFFEIA